MKTNRNGKCKWLGPGKYTQLDSSKSTVYIYNKGSVKAMKVNLKTVKLKNEENEKTVKKNAKTNNLVAVEKILGNPLRLEPNGSCKKKEQACHCSAKLTEVSLGKTLANSKKANSTPPSDLSDLCNKQKIINS